MPKGPGAYHSDESPERDDVTERTPVADTSLESQVPETFGARRAADQPGRSLSPEMAPTDDEPTYEGGGGGRGRFIFTGKEDYVTWERVMRSQLLFRRKKGPLDNAEHVMVQVQGAALEILVKDIDFDTLAASNDPFGKPSDVFDALRKVYGVKSQQIEGDAMTRLANTYQGKNKLDDFVQEFIPLAARADLTDKQSVAFMKGKLNQKFKLAAAMSQATTLGDFVAEMKTVDMMVKDVAFPKKGETPKATTTTAARATTTRPRKDKDMSKIECFGCHELGHFKNKCPHAAGAKKAETEDAGDVDIREILGNE